MQAEAKARKEKATQCAVQTGDLANPLDTHLLILPPVRPFPCPFPCVTAFSLFLSHAS